MNDLRLPTGPFVARLAVSAVLAALPLAGAGCREQTAPRAAPPPPKVTVALPEERLVVEAEELNGWTAPVATVEVRSRVRGHIAEVLFRDGDVVTAGTPLFVLDQRPFLAQVQQATGQLKVYEAQLVAAQREFVRLKELLGKGGASQSQVDKAEADAGALTAQIEAQQGEIKRLELDVEFSRITAPIAGRLNAAELTVGNLVNAGGSDPVLTSLVSIDPIHVHFDLPERALLEYRKAADEREPGNRSQALVDRKLPFMFGLETDEGYPRQGLLDFASNTVDASTGTVHVRGVVPNPDAFLLPGTRVRVRLPMGEAENALLVPDIALLADQDRRYVLVVGADGDKVVRKDVLPGRLLDDGMRILLTPRDENADRVALDDRIIVQGQQSARIHYPVEPLDADGQPVPAGSR